MLAALRDSQKAVSQFLPLVTFAAAFADCHIYKSSRNSFGSQVTLESLALPFSRVSGFLSLGEL